MAGAATIATRTFSPHDQARFAALTGDANPMHVDALYARRTQAGAAVVHGVHAALWCLDRLAAAGKLDRPVAGVEVEFRRFIYAGGDVEATIAREGETAIRAELVADGVVTTAIAVTFGARAPRAAALAPAGEPVPVPAVPLELALETLADRAGTVRAAGDAAPLFPALAARLGAERVGAIAQLSALVGMVCPGLHSIFSGFAIALVGDAPADAAAAAPLLSYRVVKVDQRFRLLRIAVAGTGIGGTVTAFVRRPPVEQPRLEHVRAFVRADEFAGTSALIVGGSRGLGALAARAIAAGGGRVAITYAVGEAEARALADEIGAHAAYAVRFDVREPAPPQLAALRWPVDQLYYFATAHIYQQKSEWYRYDRFRELCDVYVDGFARVCDALRAREGRPVPAFYPSSTYVDDRPRDMTEYAMAKAAGELLCADMNRFERGARVVVRRLPRVLTDQTATVMPVESGDPLPVILSAVRAMHEPAAGSAR